jgi:organic hydroperoxide reductase OsmC/OhrA
VAPVHRYRTRIRWTGNLGSGTREYLGYSRDHAIEVDGKPPILASSGLSPRSDPARHNPDELLVAALASCHMLWYLHLCSQAGVVVDAYTDEAEGTLELDAEGGGRFTDTVLRPRVVVRDGPTDVALGLHELAHRRCFVASSVNFPVRCEPTVVRAEDPTRSAGAGGDPPASASARGPGA